ncbi:uncharacterized protein LOC6053219 [Culex quinquefasciatus]|uniref:uncharacterized protein LOC6053219 n=1 Tax=Culex quinquefasciatus TaxID=7176 RepID=UPI0018E31812|nr:uncharacterized protein LOC6053219 [Culex quinquefasciatus]
MGKLQNKVLLKLGVIVVISAIACQAYQQQHSSDSDYSENVSQHPAAVHRHHKHHNQHRLNSVSLGHRNSSRYSIISGGSAAGNHYPQQPQQTHNYHHNSAAAGNTVGHHHQQQPQWYHSRTPRTRVNDNGAFRPGRPTGGSAQGQAGNTALGAVRPVKRMLKHNNHHNHHRNVTGKNVCTEKRTVHVPVYRKSTVKHFVQPCPDQKMCTGVRTNYEPTYQPMKREVYVCCAGWETETTIADGCLKPTCRSSCRNGGRCTAPDTCTCPAGFTGPQCAEDINECKRHKPCDQTCYNTEGSYYCTCREGFQLQSDRQSCKRMDESNDVASEARDMENDVDYDSLDTRLTKLEKIILSEDRGRSQSETHELSKKVQYALDAVSSLRSQVSRLTQRLFPVVDYGNRIN